MTFWHPLFENDPTPSVSLLPCAMHSQAWILPRCILESMSSLAGLLMTVAGSLSLALWTSQVQRVQVTCGKSLPLPELGCLACTGHGETRWSPGHMSPESSLQGLSLLSLLSSFPPSDSSLISQGLLPSQDPALKGILPLPYLHLSRYAHSL